jgi:hypothetical protein
VRIDGPILGWSLFAGLFLILLPLLLLPFTEAGVYIWWPGTTLLAFIGGGLHDRYGVMYFLAGILVDLILYSAILASIFGLFRKGI